MPRFYDLAGKRFGKLRVVRRVDTDVRGNVMWECLCDCGEAKVSESSCLRNGISTHCGCSRASNTHNLPSNFKSDLVISGKDAPGKKLRVVWVSMGARCYNNNFPRFKDWGGRGITVCREWWSLSNFLAWARPLYSDGLQLDRIDNEKDYSPENCRFVTPQDNSRNRRAQSRNKTGEEGIFLRRSGRYRAYVRSKDFNNGKLKHIGTFDTVEEASLARRRFMEDNNI